jgi:tetratricopeptide (TPR) repeat protein
VETSDLAEAREPAARAAAPAKGSQSATRQPRDPQAALVLFEEGQDLYGAGEYAQADRTFKEALALDPVNPDIADWQSKAEDQVRERRRVEAQRSTAVEAFESKDFETALRKFYRLQQEEPDGPYMRYIANSWYNWGLQFLAAGNLREADLKMNEVLTVQPDDQEALAIKKLVNEYQNRAKDRLFYIRIEALRYRPLDA